MMKNVVSTTIFSLFVLSALSAQAQNIRGMIRDAQTDEPLPFVNILFDNSQRGMASDSRGRFTINENVKRLNFSYVGYQKQEVNLDTVNDNFTVYLKPQKESLSEVTVRAGRNPAHRIIINTRKNREANNPDNLENYQYESYSKFLITADSIDGKIDTVQRTVEGILGQDSTYQEIDSGRYKLKKFVDRQHLFFMETVTQRTYNPPRDNEKVLAQRTSGFKNPIFALFITEFNNLSFYNDFIGIAGSEFVNPISKGSTGRYFFSIRDTTLNAVGDTTFYIQFRPRKGTNFDGLKGVLGINSVDWAIENIRAKPADTEQFLPVEIVQSNKKFGEHTWFPTQLDATIRLTNVNVNDVVPRAYMNRHISAVKINDPGIEVKKLDKAKVSIEDSATENTEAIMERYRQEELDSLESRTYSFMDSVGEEQNFDRRLEQFSSIVNGYFPLKYIDINIFNLLRFNRYEEVRPGLGFRTNSDLFDDFTLNAYAGFGVGDNQWKYDLTGDYNLPFDAGFSIYGGISQDLQETGQFQFVQKSYLSWLDNIYRRALITNWDYTRTRKAGVRYDPFLKWSFDVGYYQEKRVVQGNYRFRPSDDAPPQLQFNTSEMVLAARFAPGEEYARVQGEKRVVEASPLIAFLQYRRGFRDGAYGQYQYDHYSFNARYKKRLLRLGGVDIGLFAGHAEGNAPGSKLFIGHPAMIDSENFEKRNLGFASMHAFETMRYFEFLSSTYASVSYRHNLYQLFDSESEINPHWTIVNRFAWGRMEDEVQHGGMTYKTLEDGYLESGLEINKLFNINFAGIGAGFYYRYGPNALDGFGRNFAVKVSSRLTL